MYKHQVSSGRRGLGMRLTNIHTYIHIYVYIHTYIHTYIHSYYHNVVDKMSCLLGSFTWQEIRKDYMHDDLVMHKHVSPTSRWYRKHSAETSLNSLTTTGNNPDGIISIALEVEQGGTGCCCCVAHCVHYQRAFLRLVVNSNKVNTRGQTLSWPLPWHSDTCVVCSDFSSHSNWVWYICAMASPPSNCYTSNLMHTISLPPTSTSTGLLLTVTRAPCEATPVTTTVMK